ncbi:MULTISPECIES: aminotransferase class I/II-fold pyridoxal phosphate-dependent enzyme [Pontibacillus]|uniref:Aminotransferase class V-fold PLP-dependent enzyme n=1 Tax=Pontibacillus chungwhensis TaxID=265426 RepID=A0ABY8UXP2_9BACI|nr:MULTISPECIES: aminotransferase class V-fold PLP-dependent enzyme [Pontibacillus]MCD5326075.1 aminotransferase class V-fold PLP-dependent enzyme [Pontibacillus sp. HN14]WIF98178.1 aminotransferase class V-fold PLP-dependent enzyme [Pontibacillus chungwhensis]
MLQSQTPLYTALQERAERDYISMHVPGHKNGTVIPHAGKPFFENILSIDMTEITGLDDLHQPDGIIKEAQQLTAEWFKAKSSYFLVGGSTSGNLAMILAAHKKGKPFLVQRNSHKSIMHALELAGSKSIFISPRYEQNYKRFTGLHKEEVQEALNMQSDVSGLIVTSPDYFGHTSDLKEIIELAHSYDIPILVDEAHGVHFSLQHPSIPMSSLDLGADVVVQSAHKMAPAMTMGAFLHTSTNRIDNSKLTHYLQVFQSSSPSYPVLASLDLARHYLAHLDKRDIEASLDWIHQLRLSLSNSDVWTLLPFENGVDDPYKVTLLVREGLDPDEVAGCLEEEGLYPELVVGQQILFTLALTPNYSVAHLNRLFKRVESKLKDKYDFNHATIERVVHPVINMVQPNPYSYQELEGMEVEFVPWHLAIGRVASSSVTPYPPGIPFIMRGERILKGHVERMGEFIRNEKHIQTREAAYRKGIHVYIERE